MTIQNIPQPRVENKCLHFGNHKRLDK